MIAFLSTKYKSAKVEIVNDVLIDGGKAFDHWEGQTLFVIIDHYRKKCTKADKREKRFLPKIISMEEVPNVDKRLTGTGNRA